MAHRSGLRVRSLITSNVFRLMILSGVLTAVAGCKPKVNAFVAPPPPDVTVAHPVKRTVTRYVESTGTTEAFESVDLRARVAGFLEQVNFKPGAWVKKGDLLFVIDKRTYAAAVLRAQAQVAADEAAFKVADTDAKLVEKLAAQNAVSEIEIITKTGKRDAARAAVEVSKAALEVAKLDLEFCEVRAPIDGRITKNFVDVGNLVGAAGQPTTLATLVSSRPVFVTIDASEAIVLMFRRARMAASSTAQPGQLPNGEWRPVDIATADSNEFDVHGHIDYVDPALDPRSGTLRVRCRFENENDVLIPGFFVRLRMFQDTQESWLVPDIALQSDQIGRYALVVNDKDAVELKHVKVGSLDGTLRVVLEGLQPTDRVIVNGLQRARPGLTVKPTVTELPVSPQNQTISTPVNPAATQPAVPPATQPATGPAEPQGDGKSGEPHV